MDWYFQCWRKYANFDGRARRREYWYWALFNFIVGSLFTVMVGLVFGLIGLNVGSLFGADRALSAVNAVGGGAIGAMFGYFIGLGIWFLITLMPNLAVSIRRLHDLGRNDWWIVLLPTILYLVSLTIANAAATFLLALAQVGVSIWLVVLFCTDSQPAENQWGACPKPFDRHACSATSVGAQAFTASISGQYAPQPSSQRPVPPIPQAEAPVQTIPQSVHSVPQFCQTCGTALNGVAVCQTCGANSKTPR